MKFAEKAFLSESRFLTLTEEATEPGSQMLKELKLMLTALLNIFTLVQDASVPIRYQEQFNRLLPLFEQGIPCKKRGLKNAKI